MRFDINIGVVVSVEAFDQTEAQEYADRLASRFEIEADYLPSSAVVAHPSPLAVIESVERVGG